MPGPTFIAGDRLDLRTVEEEDPELLQRGVNPPEIRRPIDVFSTPQNHEQQRETFESVDSDRGRDPPPRRPARWTSRRCTRRVGTALPR